MATPDVSQHIRNPSVDKLMETTEKLREAYERNIELLQTLTKAAMMKELWPEAFGENDEHRCSVYTKALRFHSPMPEDLSKPGHYQLTLARADGETREFDLSEVRRELWPVKLRDKQARYEAARAKHQRRRAERFQHEKDEGI